MSMVISTNMSALNTTNQLNKNTTLMNSSLQKLSSGYAINSASDNSAGLAISEKMRSQIQGLDQASSNSQDATSLTQTADGALDETTTILKRMRELAVEASSDTLTDDDRTSVQDETNSLRQELDRISNDTEYNTKKLLNGDSGASTAVSGQNSAAINAALTTAGNNTTSGDYIVNYTAVATQATTGLTTTSTSGITSETASATAYAGDVSINGTTITIASGDTIEGVLKKINDLTTTTGVTATLDTTSASNNYIKLTDSTYGSSSSVTLSADTTTLQKLFNAVSSSSTDTSVTVTGTDAAGTINGAAATADGNTLTAFDLTVTGDNTALTKQQSIRNDLATATGTDTLTAAATAAATAEGTAETALAASTDTDVTTALTALESATAYTSDYNTKAAALATAVASSTDSTDAANYATYIAAKKLANGTAAAAADSATPGTTTVADYLANKTLATADVTVDATSALTFQVGANSNQTMTLSIGNMSASSLGVAGSTSTTGIDLTSASSATSAITTIDAAIKKVSAERSNLGAVQNSLDSNITNLDTESENLTSAESNIRDTDMATEMANYTKLSVITQAATAMLSKANSQPQKVLTLLQQ
ncbi:flagellin [Sporomusaceae bacterium BoRhaA]|uniref:flagellin N-terminal helical domain-containing protein n=1 Tax=Pelorhabdus rhamnosifermentans TaxID=2772457 RepID=UPI001C060C07|nr:flagellin [Pelorhabdus rhamnosifermentans]MBU2702564.1 flagellin [Pelorhabdus rhamnosifermentans]